jgi:NitT/TauT family transport system permease protein
MPRSKNVFRTNSPMHRTATWADAVVVVGLAVLLYVGVRLALGAPAAIRGPEISLAPAALPWYAGLSCLRMLAAYLLSLLFTLPYGYLAARNRRAEHVLLPLLDVLQSVPILSFLPVVLLSLTAILPERLAVELAAIVLIFTSQAWNLTFAWYQALTTIPTELREASAAFRFPPWLRLTTLELPFAALSLVWNSVMSWAGGWFFLMAAEIFSVGQRDFRLPGLGAYLQEAASQGDAGAILRGVGALVLVIVILDQLAWRPLLAWADRFKLEMVEGEGAPTSWFLTALRDARVVAWTRDVVWGPLLDRVDAWLLARMPSPTRLGENTGSTARWGMRALSVSGAVILVYGGLRAVGLLLAVPLAAWGDIATGLLLTLLRVAAALALALAWTVPLGVAIGSSPRFAGWVQPLVQIAASVPATALFPILLLGVARLPGGVNLAAVLLMLMGTQWYLLFNIIAGAAAIPQDLKLTSALLRLSRWDRWRTLILPALFPFLVTGAITASGGAWNASIVAEHAVFGGQVLSTPGIGSLIAAATAAGDYPLLLAATLAMIVAVVLLNRLVWRRIYRYAEDRCRLE